MPLYTYYSQVSDVTGADKNISFGNGSSLTQDDQFQWHNTDKIMTIGDFSATDPFEGTRYLDKGIHIRNTNPALVIEDTGATNPISLQAGSGKKVYLREEQAAPSEPIDIMTVNNSDHIEFLNAPRLVVGDGADDHEIAIISQNGSSDAATLSFYETSHENNGLQFCYDSGDNMLHVFDWSGGVVDTTPLLTIDRVRDSVRIENLELLERSSDPSKPDEGRSVIWQSDGTGFGDDGDIIVASTAGGVTRRAILFNFSAGSIW